MSYWFSSMAQQQSSVLGLVLEKIVHDIFDSSSSDSLEEEEKELPLEDHHTDPCNASSLKNRSNLSRALMNDEIYVPSERIVGKHPHVHFADNTIPSYNAEEFKQCFKISPETFEFILNLIKDDLTRKIRGNQSIPPKLQLLIALQKMTSQDSYSLISEKFKVGKATSTRAVQRVIQAIANYSTKFISWPEGDCFQKVCQGFQTSSGFPKVVGALECCQIFVLPLVPEAYKRTIHKTHHSVLLQVVVDDEGRFTHCSVGDFCENEKREVFNNSVLHKFISEPADRFPDDCHVVASCDYELHENVMVPYGGDDLTVEEKTFNESHRIAHNTVTKTISLLKSRFSSLRHKLEMSRLDLVPVYLTACCVLHNISVKQGDQFSTPVEILVPESNFTSGEISVASPQALKKRDLISKQIHISKTEGVCFV